MTPANPPYTWHLISPEFPPQVGGVGDYVYLLSKQLASLGDRVNVWCSGPAALSSPDFEVHAMLRRLSPLDLWRAGKAINRYPRPRHLVLQWVPHAFGWRSMNVPFCMWIWIRARVRGDDLGIMVHEPFLRFAEGTWRQDATALVHRVMTILLLHAARRIWVSTPLWESAWRPYAFGRRMPFRWLPLPSNVPVAGDGDAVAQVRARYASPDQVIVGHFGTFGRPITPMLEVIVPAVLASGHHIVILFVGPRGAEFRDQIIRKYPQYDGRICATGALSTTDPQLSAHLSACDVMIQPYPDGVSSRRTSLLAPLAHGVPLVTTLGPSSEPFWCNTADLAAVAAQDIESFVAETRRLIQDEPARRRSSLAEKTLYEKFFTIDRIGGELRLAYQDQPPGPGAQTIKSCAS